MKSSDLWHHVSMPGSFDTMMNRSMMVDSTDDLSGIPHIMMQPICEPRLVIKRQPKKRGYRFRYSSEGQTHGGIPGEPDKLNDKKAKVHPTIKLENCDKAAKIVLTLVTADETQFSVPFLHPHSLIVEKQLTEGYHIYDMPSDVRQIELKSVAIQHVVKEKLVSTLMRRILATRFTHKFGWNSAFNQDLDPNEFDINHYEREFRNANDPEKPYLDRNTAKTIAGAELKNLKEEAEQLGKKLKMSEVRLCVQAFLRGDNGKYNIPLDPVFSEVIFDAKTKQGAALKIIRISKVSGSVAGNEEVWIIADKINAEDLEIRFFEDGRWTNNSSIPWEAFGNFNSTEIFKQCVVIFKTPPYYDQNILQPTQVWVELRRKNDNTCHSEKMEFKYIPINRDRYGIGEKRKKNLLNLYPYTATPLSKKRYEESQNPQPISELSTREMMSNLNNLNSDSFSFSPDIPVSGMKLDTPYDAQSQFKQEHEDVGECRATSSIQDNMANFDLSQFNFLPQNEHNINQFSSLKSFFANYPADYTPPSNPAEPGQVKDEHPLLSENILELLNSLHDTERTS